MPEKYVEIVANDAVAADQFDATNEVARSGNTDLGVTTNAVSALGSTTATLEGTLDLLGGQSSVTVYFQYREAGTSTWTDTATQSLSSTGDYNQSISGLTDGTLYEYRAAAESEEAVGGIVEFRAGATLASVQTDAPTAVGEAEATLHGEVTDLGSATSADVYFQFRESDTSDTLVETPAVTISSPDTFQFLLQNLDKDVVYEYRAAADSSAGDAFGDFVEVTPSEDLAATTDAVTDLEATTATLNGTLDARGAAIDVDVNFEYREAGTSDPFTTTATQTLSQPGDFDEGITGLTDGTTYEYRALADNGSATAEGDLVEFTAGATLPTMLTFAADNVGATAADFNGELFLLGSATSVDVYFQWREVGETALNSTTPQTLSSTGLFDATVSGLTEGTTYEFRAAGSSTAGDAFGDFVEVVPGDLLPTVETDQPDSITATGARLWGDVTDLGSQLFVETGFEYWEVGVGGFQTEPGPTKNSTGRFAAFADSLQTGATYGYRALADSQAGRAYGDVVEFATLQTRQNALRSGWRIRVDWNHNLDGGLVTNSNDGTPLGDGQHSATEDIEVIVSGSTAEHWVDGVKDFEAPVTADWGGTFTIQYFGAVAPFNDGGYVQGDFTDVAIQSIPSSDGSFNTPFSDGFVSVDTAGEQDTETPPQSLDIGLNDDFKLSFTHTSEGEFVDAGVNSSIIIQQNV